jgi:hypothetical protein
MARRTTTPTLAMPMLPWAAWFQLGLKTWEMLLAAGQVIPIRLSRMALAGPTPSARDRREFTLMGAEKAQAAAQSGLAAATHLQRAWLQMWTGAATAALAPVHRTATANARRLSTPRARSRR